MHDYNPRLVKQFNEIDWGKPELGEGELTIGKSKHDPIYEIPIEKVLMAGYTEGMKIRMLTGEVIAEVDPIDYAILFHQKRLATLIIELFNLPPFFCVRN